MRVVKARPSWRYSHQALARDLDRRHPIAVLDLGSVANVTFVDGSDPIACQPGRGSALIDGCARASVRAPYDNHGDTAADGKPHQASCYRSLSRRSFFGQRTPKSLDRNAFAFGNIGLPDYSVAEGGATLSEAVVRILPHLPSVPKARIVAGGGARNLTLMNMLTLVRGRSRGKGLISPCVRSTGADYLSADDRRADAGGEWGGRAALNRRNRFFKNAAQNAGSNCR